MMTLGTGANRDLTITEKTPSILCPFLILLADKHCIATRYKRFKKFCISFSSMQKKCHNFSPDIS